MNYFFELLDSYKHRGCCVTRIDEQEMPLAQDPRLQQVRDMMSKNPPVSPNPNYKITWSENQNAWLIGGPGIRNSKISDANGRLFPGLTDRYARSILTKVFGDDKQQADQRGAASKTKGGKRSGKASKKSQVGAEATQLPDFDPEKAREEAAKDKKFTSIEDGIRDIVSQYDENAICRAQLHIENLATILRSDRDKKASVDYKVLQKLTGKAVSQSARNFLVKTFNDYYSKIQKSNDEACNFKKALEKVAKLEPMLTDFINSLSTLDIISISSCTLKFLSNTKAKSLSDF
jgi:hypothetical protein